MTLRTRFRNLSIRTKYLLAVSLLLLFLFLCGVYVFVELYHESYANAVKRARESFQESYDELTRFEDRLNHLATLLQCDSAMMQMLSGSSGYSTMEYLSAKQDLLPKLYSMQDGSGDYFCSLYVDSSLDLWDQTSRIRVLNDVLDEPWAQDSLTGWGYRKFIGGNELGADRPAFLAPLRRLDKLTEHVALFRIDISPIALRRMITLSQGDEFTSCMLLTEDGEKLASSGVSSQTDYLESYTQSERTGFASYELDERKVGRDTVFTRRLSRSGWRLVIAVQDQRLQADIAARYWVIVFISACLALAGFLCALPVLWRTTSRIRRFSDHVQAYNRSRTLPQRVTPARLEPESEDEIGLLIREHNAMLDRLDGLIAEKARGEEERRKLEVTALQAQIKPHFLYNTLDAIAWMARINQTDKVEQTVMNLTQFYRLCLSQGQALLPLEKELEIVRSYFAIAGMRYGSSVSLRIDVPEALYGILLPKITLQPLVENALVHGIMESERGEGEVALTAERDSSDKWMLVISDTGGHFSLDAWSKVMNGTFDSSAGSGSGYGLRNVERRLCLYYGRSSVLLLDTSQDDLTRILLPLS